MMNFLPSCAKGKKIATQETTEPGALRRAGPVSLRRVSCFDAGADQEEIEMVRTPFAVVLVLPLVLAACVTATPAPVPGTVDLSSCSADAVQSLIGSNIASVDTRPLAKTVRIIPPNSAVTMDYNPQRLNIETDARGVIVRMSCG